jgi:hypothetical protein
LRVLKKKNVFKQSEESIMKKTVLTLALAAVFIAASPAAVVDLGTVGDYLGSTFTLGGLEFGSFTVLASSTGGGSKVGADGIAISGEVDGDEVKLYFSGGWSADTGQTVDTLISFDVSSPKLPIVGNALSLDAYGRTGTGIASITENVLDAQDAIVANKLVYSRPSGVTAFDSAVYSPAQNWVEVTKDVFVSGGTDGYGHISGFSQSFVVPEPVTLAILALGGLMIRRKR